MAGAEDVKRGAELAGKMMNEFSFQHVALEMLAHSSQRESQGRFGYYIFFMDSLAYGGFLQGMNPQSQSKDVTYPFEPVFPFIWTWMGHTEDLETFLLILFHCCM